MKLLIPTRKQFLKWTMLNRIGYIAAVLGIFIALIQIPIWGFGAYQWLQPSPMILSPADRLIIDRNPTKLEILNISVDDYDSNHKVVIFRLKNPSNVTAKNVRVDFYNYLNQKSIYSEGVRFRDSGNGIDIPAGEIREYKVAFLGDYEIFFNPDAPGSKLLRISKNIQSAKPFELEAIACGIKNGEIPPCSFNSTGRSTVVNVKYGSIFGQKYGFLTQFYNTFLDGQVTYLPKLTKR